MRHILLFQWRSAATHFENGYIRYLEVPKLFISMLTVEPRPAVERGPLAFLPPAPLAARPARMVASRDPVEVGGVGRVSAVIRSNHRWVLAGARGGAAVDGRERRKAVVPLRPRAVA